MPSVCINAMTLCYIIIHVGDVCIDIIHDNARGIAKSTITAYAFNFRKITNIVAIFSRKNASLLCCFSKRTKDIVLNFKPAH